MLTCLGNVRNDAKMNTGVHVGLLVGVRIEDEAAGLAQRERGRKLVANVATEQNVVLVACSLFYTIQILCAVT